MGAIIKLITKIFNKLRYYFYFLYYKFYKPFGSLNCEEIENKKIIVSLTSYPARFSNLDIVIKSLLNQTYKPNKIVLYLDTLKNNEKIPRKIEYLKKYGLDIVVTEELIKPHKKYFYSMQKYPNDIIITIDDDIIYERNLIESLIKSYLVNPNAVSARRVHRMKKNKKYNEWEFESNIADKPSFDLFATGVGGVLYPPRCMCEEVFNIENISEYCLNADDIWLKFMQLLNNTKVVSVKSPTIMCIKSSQITRLSKQNVENQQNDIYISLMQKKYNIRLDDYCTE